MAKACNVTAPQIQHLVSFVSSQDFLCCLILTKLNAQLLRYYDMTLACAAERTALTTRDSARVAHQISPRRPSGRRSRLRQGGICCCAVATSVLRSQEHLQSWAKQRDKQLQNCRVEISQDTAVLLTTTSAKPGQAVLSVPDSSWISLQVVAKSPIGKLVAALEPWLQLSLYILYSLSHQDSDWSQYLLSLPTSLDVPLLWSEDELDLLEGTQLLSTVQGYRYKTGISLQAHFMNVLQDTICYLLQP